MYTGLGGWLLRLAAELAGPRGTPRELAGRRCRTPEDSRRTLAGTGAGLCRTSKDAPSCRGSFARECLGMPSVLQAASPRDFLRGSPGSRAPGTVSPQTGSLPN